MEMTKDVEIAVNIDRARMTLRMEGFDVDNLTENQIFEKSWKSSIVMV